MIKLNKPKRYANMCKISNEAMNNSIVMKLIKNDLKRIKRLPKNTLKVKLIKFDTGLHMDDFVRNLSTARAEFEVITFRR